MALFRTTIILASLAMLAVGCTGSEGPSGPAGEPADVDLERVDDLDGCDGAGVIVSVDGAVGAVICDGLPGDDGDDGRPGDDGDDGDDGLSPAITTDRVDDLPDCDAGGLVITVTVGDGPGVDTFVCDGAPGGSPTIEVADVNDKTIVHDCGDAGGYVITVTPAEGGPSSKTVVCNGADGQAPTVVIDDQPSSCGDAGGVAVTIGSDEPFLICNGAQGQPGQDGQDGQDGFSPSVVINTIAPGDTCPEGGVDVAITSLDDQGQEITESFLLCSGDQPSLTILELVANDPNFSLLAEAAGQAGLAGALDGTDELTVFAPTDQAFSDLLDQLALSELGDVDESVLADILLYHVLGGTNLAADLQSGVVTNLDGRTLLVDTGALEINGVAITETDIEAANGVIHVIDQVILPPGDIVAVATELGFSDLVAAADDAGLVGALTGDDPLTVFAPTDDAFTAIADDLDGISTDDLQQILLHHVLDGAVSSFDISLGTVTALSGFDVAITADGGNLFFGNAQIIVTDVITENGIIHAIDSVLFPPTLVDIAQADTNLDQLVAAAIHANLVDVLSGSANLTVFAPTDDAFEALLNDLAVDDITDLPAADVADILLYHVVAGQVLADDLNSGVVETSDGRVLLANLEGTAPTVNGVTITDVDLLAANGAIHKIDQVLLPPGNIVDVAIAAGFDELAAAVVHAGLVDALSGADLLTVFAPTNAAFQALYVDLSVNDITEVDANTVAAILQYHVLAGALSSFAVTPGVYSTLEGTDVEIAVDGADLLYDDATIIITDVVAENGVIHAIDQVVTP